MSSPALSLVVRKPSACARDVTDGREGYRHRRGRMIAMGIGWGFCIVTRAEKNILNSKHPITSKPDGLSENGTSIDFLARAISFPMRPKESRPSPLTSNSEDNFKLVPSVKSIAACSIETELFSGIGLSTFVPRLPT
jgi:hypothetical protein